MNVSSDHLHSMYGEIADTFFSGSSPSATERASLIRALAASDLIDPDEADTDLEGLNLREMCFASMEPCFGFAFYHDRVSDPQHFNIPLCAYQFLFPKKFSLGFAMRTEFLFLPGVASVIHRIDINPLLMPFIKSLGYEDLFQHPYAATTATDDMHAETPDPSIYLYRDITDANMLISHLAATFDLSSFFVDQTHQVGGIGLASTDFAVLAHWRDNTFLDGFTPAGYRILPHSDNSGSYYCYSVPPSLMAYYMTAVLDIPDPSESLLYKTLEECVTGALHHQRRASGPP